MFTAAHNTNSPIGRLANYTGVNYQRCRRFLLGVRGPDEYALWRGCLALGIKPKPHARDVAVLDDLATQGGE